MKIGILSTGDELLRGAIADTNGAWMAAELDVVGHSVSHIEVVGDDLDELATAMRSGLKEYDLLVVGGGLGPTEDDLTAEAAARATGRELGRDEEAARQVERAFERIDRPMAPINLKQADLPSGSAVLENEFGTAPGFSLEESGGRIVCLPGVPRELKPMFARHVLATLPDVSRARHRVQLRCFGRGESDIQQLFGPIAEDHREVRWSYRSTFPEIGVTLSSPDADALERAANKARAALGVHLFAEGETSLPAALGEVLAARGLTVSCAESCTGGLIGHSLTEVPGSSAYFRGGVIAYANQVKTDLLGVPEELLAAEGAVSEPVVRAMAEGVRQSLGTDLGMAVSGVAGPGGGTEEKPVGLVHLAVAYEGGVDHKRRIFHGYGRPRVKKVTAWAAIWMALGAAQRGTEGR